MCSVESRVAARITTVFIMMVFYELSGLQQSHMLSAAVLSLAPQQVGSFSIGDPLG